jgi:hypothetical protein
MLATGYLAMGKSPMVSPYRAAGPRGRTLTAIWTGRYLACNLLACNLLTCKPLADKPLPKDNTYRSKSMPHQDSKRSPATAAQLMHGKGIYVIDGLRSRSMTNL